MFAARKSVLLSNLMRPVLLAIFVWASLQISVGAEVRITPSTPPAVAAGACFQFTANYAGTWSVTCQGEGCQAGTINATGRYCAPLTVAAKNQSRGCQLGPNDNVYNVPINRIKVHSYSSRWLARIATENDGGANSWLFHRFNVQTPGALGLYDNVVDNSTPKQERHFFYGGPWQDTAFSQPLPPLIEMENGWSLDRMWDWDRHQFAINRQTCDDQEIYGDYVDFKSFNLTKGNPTIVKFTTDTIRPLPNPMRVYVAVPGNSCRLKESYLAKVIGPGEVELPFDSTHCSLQGVRIGGAPAVCSACNSGSGAHWPVASNAILNGVDAAGSPMSRTSVHPQQWWNVVQKHILDPACNCVTLGHAIRTTLTNSDIAPADLWPTVSGRFVTWGHPQIHPASIRNTNPVEFVLSSTECNGKSFLQCGKPCDNWTFSIGCQFYVVLGGGTGAWAQLNGKHFPAVITANDSFKIPVNSSGNPLPGSLYFYFDWAPYGTRFRLKPSFNVAAFCTNNSLDDKCPYEKAILNTLQVYGLVLLDGTLPGDNWDSGFVSDEFFPDPLVDAIRDLNHNPALGYNPRWPAGGGFEQYLDIVDESGLQVSTDPNLLGLTNSGRVTATLTTDGHGSASVDVILLGTTVGVERSRIAIAAMPENVFQIHAWVNGNADHSLSFTMNPVLPGASVSREGFIKPPSTLTKIAKTTVDVCSAAKGASNACAYIDVFFIPVARDGSVRLWFGGKSPSLTDSAGNTWWGALTTRSFDSHYEIADGVNFANLLGTWSSNAKNWSDIPNAELYAQSTASQNDTLLNIALPNGHYALTLYGEPGFGTNAPGQDVFDIEINGQVVESYQDGFVLAGGQYHGWTKHFDATVNNGVLEVGGRIREESTYGMSLSSLLITPRGR